MSINQGDWGHIDPEPSWQHLGWVGTYWRSPNVTYKVQFFKDNKWHTWCVMMKKEWAEECEELLKRKQEYTRIVPQGEEDV